MAAALAIAGALFVASAAASVVLAHTVFRSAGLPAGAVRALTVTCPRGYVAASGGVSRAARGVEVLRARPSGPRAFAFRLGNPVSSSARRVGVSVACWAIRAPAGPDIALRQIGPSVLSIAPHSQRATSLACPSDTGPAGAGVDLAPGVQGQAAGFTGTQLSVRSMTTSLRGFSYVIRNSGANARTVAVSGNCITVVSSPGAPRAQLGFKVTTFRSLFRPGRRSTTRACPLGWRSLATGYSLPSPSLSLEGAAAVAGAGRWWVTNAGGAPTRLVLQLVCARLA